MRERVSAVVFVLGAGVLLYLGRHLVTRSIFVSLGLTFAGTSAAAVLGLALYRVRLELRASRYQLAREQAELNFAREVQEALFPRRFPLDGGLEFAGLCVPARIISGDYYDVLELGGGRVAFAVADIVGKGISAAILMSNVHAVSRTLAEAGHGPAEVCAQLNRHLYRITDSYRFATFFYAEWNRTHRRLRYVNAGHTQPILRGSSCRSRLEEGGLPLGIFGEAEYRVGELCLTVGDLLVLYSDGITEAGSQHDQPFGEARLEALIEANRARPLVEIRQKVLEAVQSWAGREAEDDITLLLVRATPPAGEAP